MPQSLSIVYIHLMFSTKERRPFLRDPGLRASVHGYLGEISKRLDCPPIQVGGVEDHIHLLAGSTSGRNLFEVEEHGVRQPQVARGASLFPRATWGFEAESLWDSFANTSKLQNECGAAAPLIQLLWDRPK